MNKNPPQKRHRVRRGGRIIKGNDFAGGDLTPPLTKGDVAPLWKPHLVVPASRGGVNDKSIKISFLRDLRGPEKNRFIAIWIDLVHRVFYRSKLPALCLF